MGRIYPMKRRKLLAALLLAVAPTAFCSAQETRDSTTPFDSRFQALREFVMKDIATGRVPSVSIAVAQNGEVVWAEAFGWADKENGIPAAPNTMYRMASISKPITATAIMRLADSGLVDLDAPIQEYLGGLTLRYYTGTPEEVTVRRVLQHRAGLPAHDQAFYLDEEPERRSFEETVRRYGIVVFEPGLEFIYANLGYMLLARAVEQVTGLDFPRYVRDSVFTPLGMGACQVFVAGDEFEVPPAKSYYGINGEPVPRSTSAYPGPDDVYCSAQDLLRFAMFHLKDHLPDQMQILSDSAIDEMQRQNPPSNTRYGLGWSFDVDRLGFRSMYHGGQTIGVSNFIVFVPSEDLAVVILANTDYSASRLLHIQGAVRAALIPEYGVVNPWASDAADPLQYEADTSAVPAIDAVSTQPFPEEMLGTWEGKIVAYDREIDVSLVLSNAEGARIELSGQGEYPVSFTVISSGFLLGTFPGRITTADIERYHNWIRLAIQRTGDTLSGQATAVGWRKDRQTHTEQSAWIELERHRSMR
jgi:CubicO group peptidase (beta-lactamase class C family)